MKWGWLSQKVESCFCSCFEEEEEEGGWWGRGGRGKKEGEEEEEDEEEEEEEAMWWDLMKFLFWFIDKLGSSVRGKG